MLLFLEKIYKYMERRLFFRNITLPLAGSILHPLMPKPQPPKPKVCMVSIGTTACKVAAAIYKALPYEVNYHAIDTTNKYHYAHSSQVTRSDRRSEGRSRR